MNGQQELYRPQGIKQRVQHHKNQTPMMTQTDKYSANTNSADIVKVKESNYAMTSGEVQFTDFNYISNPNNNKDSSIFKHPQKMSMEFNQTKTISPFKNNQPTTMQTSQTENRLLVQQLNLVPSQRSVLNYSLKSFQEEQIELISNEIQEEDSFAEDFNVNNKHSNRFQKDHEMEQILYQQSTMKTNQRQDSKKSQGFHSNDNQQHSLYSDDNKKSVFLYSSSNDDIIQSQLSNRLSQQANTTHHRNSSKQSLQIFSHYNSNNTLGITGNGGNQEFNNNNNAMIKNSNNMIINSEMNQRDGGGMVFKHFLETDGFEIKEVEDENCYTPINQFYPYKQQLNDNDANQGQIINYQEVEDSFKLCDYEDYMEEKCSLSENLNSQQESPQRSNIGGNNSQQNKKQFSTATSMNASSVCGQQQNMKVFNIDTSNNNIRYQQQVANANMCGLPPKPFQNTVQQYSDKKSMNNQSHISQQQQLSSFKKSQYQVVDDVQIMDFENTNKYVLQEGQQQMVEYLTSSCEEPQCLETFGQMENECSPQSNQEEQKLAYYYNSAQFVNEEQQHIQQDQQEEYLDVQIQEQYENYNEMLESQEQDVVARLINAQRAKNYKLEQQRLMKQNEELMQLLPKPIISKTSQAIIKTQGHNLPSFKDTQHYFEQKKRIEDLKRIYEMDKMKEVTGKPQISSKAKNMQRGLNDLYTWEKENRRKKEELKKLKEQQERNEIENHQEKAQHYVNKVSEKYIQNKENLYSNRKIEERLLQVGKMTKQKIEIMAKHKQIEQKEMANQLHNKKKELTFSMRKNSASQQRISNESILSNKDLEVISKNQQRQNLYQKYYNEKKKEAEGKHFSQTMIQSNFLQSPIGQIYSQHPTDFIQSNSRNNLAAPNYSVGNSLSLNNLQTVNPLLYDLNTPSRDNICYQSYQNGLGMSIQQNQVPYFEMGKPIQYCSFGHIPQMTAPLINNHALSNDTIPLYQEYQQKSLLLQPTGELDVYQILREANKNSSIHISNASTSCFDNSKSNVKKNDTQVNNNVNCQSARGNQKNSFRLFANQTQSSKNKSKSRDQRQKLNTQQSLSPKRMQQASNLNLSPKQKPPIINRQTKMNNNNKSKNDQFVERQRKWSQERQRKIEQEQDKLNLINTLKCTFKPSISENSKKLMSPSASQMSSARQQRGTVYDYDKNVNFNKELLHQFIAGSQISPFKEMERESFLSGQGQDFNQGPFLEQNSSSFYNSDDSIQMIVPLSQKLGSNYSSIKQNMLSTCDSLYTK